MEELIYFGSAVKALGGGRVGGYLAEFTDFDARKGTPPDLVREFFTKSTDYDIEPGEKRSVYFDHGQDPTLKHRKLSKAELKVDEVGVWAETILDTRDKYLQKIYELAEQGKLGWSSGSVPHLVEKKKHADGFMEIVRWPIAEASLTHRPCNPFSQAIPLKSYAELEAAPLDGSAPVPTKNVLDEEMSQERDSVWRVWSAFTSIVEKSARTAADSAVTGVEFDHESKIREAAYALPDKLLPPVLQQVTDFLNSESREHFYLKSLFDEFNEDGLPAGLPFAERLEMVRAAVERVAADANEIQGMRVKAGRVISAANRTRIQAVVDAMTPLLADLSRLLEESEAPQKMADPDTVRGLLATFEMTRPGRLMSTARRQ